ncbi:MAG: DUF1329 domain-containing protein [Desulfuromonadales bacterium]|nr:DUF1329 domain-containing protein [Desulfuromonadales bacterium]
MNRKITAIMCILLLGVTLGIAQAKVTPEEAAKLKDELTPMGAERAGNADSTIPEWSGGIEAPAGYKSGEWLVDPFAGEKLLFTITRDNYEQYADKLAPSQIETFKHVPDFKMNIFPTHRTVGAPHWVVENTYNNSLSAELVDEGNGV